MVHLGGSSKTGDCFQKLFEGRTAVTVRAGEGASIDWEGSFLQGWECPVSGFGRWLHKCPQWQTFIKSYPSEELA